MTAIVVVMLSGLGVHLLWSSLVLGERDLLRRRSGPSLDLAVGHWLRQAGLDGIRPREFVAVTISIGIIGGSISYALFGSTPPALLTAIFSGVAPYGLFRSRRQRRLEKAREAWPRIIEEIRILTGSVGRSIPQALFEAGLRAPEELQAAFRAAHREWLITTDFERTIAALKAWAADPTADSTCETLLVAYEVGGGDLGYRLEALAEDRLQDLDGRRDARAKQAGVRFARLFVLIVPLGMAIAGLSIGDGREAYRSGMGQLMVCLGLALVLGCWVWAGRFLRLPEAERVFDR